MTFPNGWDYFITGQLCQTVLHTHKLPHISNSNIIQNANIFFKWVSKATMSSWIRFIYNYFFLISFAKFSTNQKLKMNLQPDSFHFDVLPIWRGWKPHQWTDITLRWHHALTEYWVSNSHSTLSGTLIYNLLLKMQVKWSSSSTIPVSTSCYPLPL